jgi:hypothetical protein
MASRVDELASEFERIHAGVIEFAESLSDDEWDAYVPNEERSAGVVIQHIAFGYTSEIALIQAIVSGDALPSIYENRDALNEYNAQHAGELRRIPRAEAMHELRRQGDEALAYLRGLSDADLARTRPIGLWNGEEISVGWLIERIVLGHPQGHLTSIRAALGREPAPQRA